MARRNKSKKRKFLGSRSYGGGNAKNRRGKGNRGGVGRAGWHKHNWLRTIKLGEHKPSGSGFHSRFFKPATMTLENIVANAERGVYEKKDNTFSINAVGSKVVGSIDVLLPLNITAYSFSKNAKQKIEEAGGKCTTVKIARAKKTKLAAAPSK